MNIDDIVRRARPDSTGWTHSEAGRRVLDEIVTAAPAEGSADRRVAGRSGPALRWSLLGTGLAGAVAAGVLAVSVISTPQQSRPDSPPVAGQQPDATTTLLARDILLAAANRAEQAPAETGRYWHVKTLDLTGPQRAGDAGYWLLRRSVTESWDASDPAEASWTGHRDLGVRPASQADERAWRAAGAPSEWTLDTDGPKPLVLSTRPDAGTLSRDRSAPRYLEDLGQLDLEQVRRLPDEPRALRAWTSERIRARMGVPAGSPTSDRLLFGFLGRMLLDTPAPPKVRGAAFRILAEIPGVRGLDAVTDAHGRSGQGVEFRDDSGTVRLIVDPSTHRLLGEQTSSTPKDAAVPGKQSTTVVLTAQWSDAAPQRPSLPQE
ncbi:CU044_5270 family protein [Micromonospora sp. WMMD1120]|uniref:CU044_5270 family protein n=1 Tax=Micromonospora sp. WMMD1120 TaxID=3016106 RepID=UPI002416CA1D|nr:CU044_5270 family protein [Micromonospora sp. WMMD1120]MDG4810097.1 CU044_5270 family protein [Micromonospora sp. WMMD1120]